MAVTVKIPAQLRGLTGNESEAQVEGGSVGEALDALYARFDGLRDLPYAQAAQPGRGARGGD